MAGWMLVAAVALAVAPLSHAETPEWVGPQPDTSFVDAVWDGQRLVALGRIYNAWQERVDTSIWTSPDGATWRRISNAKRLLNAIAWNGSVYVGAGAGVVSSADGVTWTDRTPAGWTWGRFEGVIWTGQLFVAVGWASNPYRGVVATSPEGVVWTRQTLDDVSAVTAIVSNGSTLVAVGRRVFTSPDGLTWTSVPDSEYPELRDLCWIGDKFVGISRDGWVYTSPDGATWSWVVDLKPTGSRWRLGWNGSLAVASGDGVFTSPDGATWTERVPPTKTVYSINDDVAASLAWTGSRWAARGYLTSPDGLTWHDWRFSLKAGATSGDTEVAVGDDGMILVSRNGAAWTYSDSPTSASLPTVVWDGEQFLAAGAQRTLVASADGVIWQHRTSGLDADIVHLVWTGSRFVAVLADGGLASSVDGVAWSRATATGGFADVASAGWRLVAVGKAGLVATSHDGVTWTRQPSPTSSDLTGVTWTGRSFIAAGPAPIVLRSADGERWQSERAPTLTPSKDCTFSSLGVSSERDVVGLWVTQTCSNGKIYPRGCWRSSNGSLWAYAKSYGSTRDCRVRTGHHLTALGENEILRTEVPEHPIIVPMAAHTQGANGTFWRTDVEVLNRGREVARYEVELLPRAGSTGTVPVGSHVVQPGASRRHRDVLHDVQGGGALRIRTVFGQVEVTSHTATDGAAGTVGQLVPGIPEEDAFVSGYTARLVGLSQASDRSEGFRSNLGVVNLSAVPIALAVAIHLPSGALLGTIEATAPPGSLLQIDEVIRRVTQAPVPAAYALVSSSTLGAAFVVWASVVDNRTGDPTLVMAR